MTTLHYFKGYGRGELIRFLLHHTGTEFTDHQITFEEWPELKGTDLSPTGLLPVLEIDGNKLTSSIACASYIARKAGIYPTDPYAVWGTLAIIDHIEDFIAQYVGKLITNNQAGAVSWWNKAKKLKLGIMNGILEKNNGGDGFLFGNSLTMGDLALYQFLWDGLLRPEVRDARAADLNAFPKLKAFADRMATASPGVQKYLQDRFVSPV